MRRPRGATMRSMTPSTARSLVKPTGCGSMRPARSTKISSCRLTMISVMRSSASSASSGPRPIASSRTSCCRAARSSPGGSAGSDSMMSVIRCEVSSRNSASDMCVRSRRRRSMVSSSRSWMRLRHSKREAQHAWAIIGGDAVAPCPSVGAASRSAAEWGRTGSTCAAPARSRTRSRYAPTTISSANSSGPWRTTRVPFTQVPEKCPRSSRMRPRSPRRMRACSRPRRQPPSRTADVAAFPITA